MGIKNYLIDGGSGTGKTTVAQELHNRGYHVLHGDRELRYRGDPSTGRPLEEPSHKNEKDKAIWRQKHQLWNLDKVHSVIADKSTPISFFCGGARNTDQFTDLLDGVFILDVADINIIFERLDERVARDPTDFGGKPEEKELVSELHKTKEDISKIGIIIDATAPLESVVRTILSHCAEPEQKPAPSQNNIK